MFTNVHQVIKFRVVGGEMGATSSLAPKVSSWYHDSNNDNNNNESHIKSKVYSLKLIKLIYRTKVDCKIFLQVFSSDLWIQLAPYPIIVP